MITKEQKKFAFIESNTTGTGELLILRALNKNLVPVFFTKNPHKYSFLPMEPLELIIINTDDRNILYKHLKTIENLSGIYSSSEYYIETAAILAKKLGFPGTNPTSIKICRDKYILYQTLTSAGIEVPKSSLASTLSEVEKIISENTFPLIVKPVCGSGSTGVKRCETKNEALDQSLFIFKELNTPIIIQEYIEGPEFSVETCSTSPHHHNIIGITKKHLGAPPYFVEIGHDFPAIIKENETILIQQYIQNILCILKFDFGFSHIELKISNNKIFMIEVNPRLAGGMIPILIYKSTGLDLLDDLLDLYTGQHIALKASRKKHASIRHLIPQKSGVITQLDFKNKNNAEEIKLIKHPGDLLHLQGDYRDRIAYTIVSDKHAQTCLEKAENSLKNFILEIKDALDE